MLTEAARFINTTEGHIFLTGKAGTGKTTFLKSLKSITYKSHIVVAPTGIAALNAGGVTIHSQFLLPPANFIPAPVMPPRIAGSEQFIDQQALSHKHFLSAERKKVLRSIDLLVIDEVSMLRADLLDAIDYRMRSARGNFKQSFGGVQVLFIGDLFQLPPVVKPDAWNVLSEFYPTPWFYEARVLRQDPPVYIELEEIFRQSDDRFIRMLNNLRNNLATPEDIASLNEHFKTPEELHRLRGVITLTTHNYKADEINLKELRALEGESHFFEADIENEFPESMFPVLPRLELKLGAQVMFVRNDSEGKSYYNGKLATVSAIQGEKVWVEMEDSAQRIELKKETWENKKYQTAEESQELVENVVGRFRQFPVKLAWAITVHKSQGLTFEKAIIDVGQAFADGQVYVALSRLKSLDGLILRTRIHPSVISTDRNVINFTEANYKPSELNDKARVRQEIYIRSIVDRTFDFTALVKSLKKTIQEYPEEIGAGLRVLSKLIRALEEEQENTIRYRHQLARILESGDQGMFMERLQKGQAYYRALIAERLRELLYAIETVKQRKRVKTLLGELSEVDQMISKRLSEIDRTALLIGGILKGEQMFSQDAVDQARKAEREQWLAEIRKEIGEILPKKKKKKKVYDENGAELSTMEVTLNMFRNGLNIAQIAETRGLKASTIETHLATAADQGLIEVTSFIPPDAIREIMAAMGRLPEEAGSKDLFAALKGKYTYGQLRAVSGMKKVI